MGTICEERILPYSCKLLNEWKRMKERPNANMKIASKNLFKNNQKNKNAPIHSKCE